MLFFGSNILAKFWNERFFFQKLLVKIFTYFFGNFPSGSDARIDYEASSSSSMNRRRHVGRNEMLASELCEHPEAVHYSQST